jgi:PAS domain S-box-containing protein
MMKPTYSLNELRRTKEHLIFSSVMEVADDAIISMDANQRITLFNQGAEKIFGYAAHEILGQSLDMLLPARFRNLHYRYIEEFAKSSYGTRRMDQRGDIWGQRKDGNEFPAEASIVRLDLDGKQIFTVILRDMTKRKQAEEALRESEKRYRTLVETADDAILLLDLEFNHIFENSAFYRGLGFKRGENIGKGHFARVHPDDVPQLITQMDELFETGKLTSEYRIQHKDGRWLHRFSKSVVVYDDHHKPEAILTIMRDITERKQDEDMLKQRAAQLDLINKIGGKIASVLALDSLLELATRLVQETFNYHHVAIFFVDNGILRLKSVAGFYKDYFPVGRHTQRMNEGINGWVATHGQKLIANDVRDELRYISLIPEHTITKAELCLPIKIADRTVGILDIQSPQTNSFTENDIVAVEALTTQIAVAIENARLYEEVQEERTLLAQRIEERTAELSKANAELSRVARLKDEFLANMSHELRTPLNAILNLSEALEEQVYGPLNGKQLKYIFTVKESGRHLLALINDILELSKIEAGKLNLQIAPVLVESICQTSLRMIKQNAHKKNISIEFNSTLDKTTKIQADARRFKQILVNLLSNAVKFTPQDGAIGLNVVDDPEQHQIQFIVWDSGIGIANEDIKRLFQPFVQLDSSLSRQYEGTGLGLALVYQLTEMHGGTVSVESKIREGSRFIISLPRLEATEDSHVEEIVPHKSITHAYTQPQIVPAPLILVAEDNQINLDAMANYLRIKGYRLVTTRNGQEAIDQAREARPDLILMDIQMPVMDGLEAIRILQADPELATIPIITLTALTMPGDRERCLAAGASNYVSKPVSLKMLVEVIKEQLNSVAQDMEQ